MLTATAREAPPRVNDISEARQTTTADWKRRHRSS